MPISRCLYCNGDLALAFPSLAVDRSDGPRRGWMYAVWPEGVVGTLEPIIGGVTEREPNENQASATRVAYGQSFSGNAISPDISDDSDNFYFEGRSGDNIQMTGEITGVSPYSPYSYCGTSLLLGYGGLVPGDYLGIVGCGAYDQGGRRNPPLLLTLPKDGRYFTSMSSGDRHNISYRGYLQRLVPSPTSVARDHRDLVMVVSSDGGRSWSEKRLVNDDPIGFENYLPEVAVDGLGRVHVSWYDRRDDPEYGINYHVYFATSTDGGATFLPSRRLSETQAVITRPYESNRLGDRMGLVGTEEGVIGAWTFTTPEWLGDKNQHDIHVRGVDVPTGAGVLDLVAEPAVGRVELSWRVVEPEVMSHCVVRRRPAGGAAFDSVATIARASDFRAERYAFTDTSVSDGLEYDYQVDLILANRRSRVSEPVSTRVLPRPALLELRLVASGGGDAPVQIELTSPVSGAADVRVFDVQGSIVRSMTGVAVQAGMNSLSWDGRDDSGHRPAVGVYFMEARVAEYRASLKIVTTGR
ncbi:MAG: FlgD immunoglobulin-like domain containing protein [Candidatus Eisenbacteria bacterium]|nr:FlgD immunoglobulin-like domain containing protein [Candidatus Eisenbacteria bacterium]